jgi:hypothetical protein
MRTDRETTRIVRSWLEDGVTSLPDRVLDAVLDELPATRQHRAQWWRARTLLHVNRALAYGVAAAAVVIVAMLGIGFLSPGGPSVGGPGATPTPTATASPVALPDSGILQAGAYVIDDYLPFRITFDVPGGWQSCPGGPHEIGACFSLASDPGRPMGIAFLTVDNVVADPCDRSMPELGPPVGPSVDDLVTAISDLEGFTATEAVDVTVDGFRGTQFEVAAPDDASHCPSDGDIGFGTWRTPSRTNGVAAGEVNLVRVLDVDGVRLVVTAAYHPSIASPEMVAEIRRVFESVHIAP